MGSLDLLCRGTREVKIGDPGGSAARDRCSQILLPLRSQRMNATAGRLSKRTIIAKRRSKIARWLVMFLVRLGGQAQSSDLPSHQFPTAGGVAVRPGRQKLSFWVNIADSLGIGKSFVAYALAQKAIGKSTGAGFDRGVIPCEVISHSPNRTA
jgi:hypothetical protein